MCIDCSHLAEGGIRCVAVVKLIKKIQVSKMREYYLPCFSIKLPNTTVLCVVSYKDSTPLQMSKLSSPHYANIFPNLQVQINGRSV